MVACGIYYYFWISLIPKLRGYRIRQVVLNLDGGDVQSHKLIKVPLTELADWDANHDAVGRPRGENNSNIDGTKQATAAAAAPTDVEK